jgi:ubiquinone/menaquinone biosynthesis C-methylase UbiE
MAEHKSAYCLDDFQKPAAEIARLKKQALMYLDTDKKIWSKTGVDFSQQGLQVVELACGLGITTCELAKMTHGGKVIGVDNNTTLLEYARKYAQEQNIDNIEYTNQDVYDLTFPKASIDFVFSQLLLLFLSHPNRVMDHVYRMLKPGGIACFVEVDERIALSYPELPEVVSFQKQAASDLKAQGFDFRIGPKLGGYLHNAGFTDIQVSIELVTSDQVGLKKILDYEFETDSELQPMDKTTLEQIDKMYKYYLDTPYAWLSTIGGFYGIGRKSHASI